MVPMTRALPSHCGVAFKEWSGVRDALASGRQTIILRKGGIHEGPRGFVPEYGTFWLYPTHVHESEQGIRNAPADLSGKEPAGYVAIGTLAVIDRIGRVESMDELEAIADEHAWTPETIRKRFDYKRPGLWLLAVRIFDRPDPWAVEITPAHAGCKTWVPLESTLPTDGLAPVIDDRAFAARLERLQQKLPEGRLALPNEEG
jgi:hypothetical protein